MADVVNIFGDEWDEPAMRTPDGFGWRSLGVGRRLGGELVSFRASPDGAHQLRNDGEEPARVLMLSTRLMPEILEYPDTGKVGLATGPGQRRLLRTDAGGGYWGGGT